jgi:O-acetyl-ADP-ribose deacetylase (regulator of RNase III)
MTISYIKGDATVPSGNGCKIIPHVCNNIGAWGAGFVMALSKKWVEPEASYRKLYADQGKKLILGTVQFVPVKTNGDSWNEIIIANMIAQSGIKSCQVRGEDLPPIRYDALFKCLKEVAAFAKLKQATIHAPRFGAGLSGGDWDVIEALIASAWSDLQVTVYDFPVAPTAPSPLNPIDPLDDII